MAYSTVAMGEIAPIVGKPFGKLYVRYIIFVLAPAG